MPDILSALIHFPSRAVGDADAARALGYLLNLGERAVKRIVVTFDGAIHEHRLSKLIVQRIGFLGAAERQYRFELSRVSLLRSLEHRRRHVPSTPREV